MKKNRFAVIAAFIAAAVICAAAALFLPKIIATAVCIAAAGAAAYFALYFRSIKYSVTDGALFVTGGLIFRRTHILPLNRILWYSRLLIPFTDRAAFTVLHTAGGSVVIFTEPPTVPSE